MDQGCRLHDLYHRKLGPEARSDYREFAGFFDFEPPMNVKKLPVKKKGPRITAMSVFDRAA